MDREKLNQIASAYENELFCYNPELAMYFGRNIVEHDKFKDHSLKATYAWQRTEDNFLYQLNQLSENNLKNFPEYLTYRLLRQTLIDNKKIRICKEELWNINPQTVNAYDFWQSSLMMLAEKQPIGKEEYRKFALKRWETFPEVVKDEIDNLKEGLALGFSAPRCIVQVFLNSLKSILHSSIINSPYFDFARRDDDTKFKQAVEELIKVKINPSIQKYTHFLENEYLIAARNEIGINSLPCSDEGYIAKLQKETTLNIQANEIFQYGIEYMKELEEEIVSIGYKIFKTKSLEEIFRLAKSEPQFRFHSEEEILKYNRLALARAYNRMPLWFKNIPKSNCIIKPFSAHFGQMGTVAEYHPPNLDEQSPGIFYINTYAPGEQNRLNHEAVLFHELIPGHHYQTALLYEADLHHSLNKYLWHNGYDEGWGLYAERLADEMGLYSDDISRLGMLSNEAWRTARLVIDPGIHVMNWTREEAVQYLRKKTTLNENTIQAEIDRYIMSPGQAASYMVGKREIITLRNLSQEKLKNNFDIKNFHEQILKHGSITLPIMRENILSWISETLAEKNNEKEEK